MSQYLTKIWNHKKKIIFFSGVAVWGANYGLEKKRVNDIMRELCLQAKAFGDAPIKPGQSVRKAVVILNYGAHKSKSRKFYDNYAAPLLNLAGIQLTLYTTSDTTKLREYLEHMEPSNAVIFAGGDSTIFECIKGHVALDRPEFRHTPVGILPLGFSNIVYNSLRPDNSKESIKIANAAMAIVKGSVSSTDILELKMGDKEERDYAVSGVQWGPLKDVEHDVTKYWYMGPLDKWYAYARAFAKGHLRELSASLQYVNVCKGCARCEQIPERSATRADQTPLSSQLTTGSWWQSLIPRKKTVLAQELDVVPELRHHSANEDCGVIHETAVVTKDLHLLSQNVAGYELDGSNGMLLTYHKDGSGSFIDQVLKRHRQIHTVPKLSNAKEYEKLFVSDVRIIPSEADLARYPTIEIDGHNVDFAGPVRCKLHARKLLLFNDSDQVI